MNEPKRHKFSTFTANDPLRANPTTNMPANRAQPPQEAAGGPGLTPKEWRELREAGEWDRATPDAAALRSRVEEAVKAERERVLRALTFFGVGSGDVARIEAHLTADARRALTGGQPESEVEYVTEADLERLAPLPRLTDEKP